MRNFWELFRNNNYKPIHFVRHGNVQEKINNGLREEKAQLDKILELKLRFVDVEERILNTIEEIKKSKKTPFFDGYDFNYLQFLHGLSEIQQLIK